MQHASDACCAALLGPCVQMEVVSNEVRTALGDLGIKSALYWGHETAPGRLVAIQRLALAAGVAWLHDATHLSLHSDHG
jgi:hypothetical protein